MELSPMERSILEGEVVAALRTVFDPEIPVNIYELGLVYNIDVDSEANVVVRMTLTSPGCPVAGTLPPEVEEKTRAVSGVNSAKVDLVWDPPWDMEMMTEEANWNLECGEDKKMTETTMDLEKAIFTVTPDAVKQVKFLIAKKGNPNLALRVGVKGGGCSGLSYTMNLEENPTDRDIVFETDGLRVFIDKKSASFIEGTVLDYTVKNLLEGGWKWTNPKAARSCGCGTSFTPK